MSCVPLRRVVVTLLGAWVFTIGACTAFVAYLFSTRLLLTNTGVYSSATAGRLLLIASISSRAASVITPFIMTLVAFKLSAEWLRSENFDGRVDKRGEFQVSEESEDLGRTIQPSATQFSNIASLCSSASPYSALYAVRHLFTSPATSGNAFLLVIAVRALVPLLAVSYALAVVEGIWLHAATLPILLPLNTTLPFSQNRRLSRTIDNFCKQNPVYSDCDGEQVLAGSLQFQGNSCSDDPSQTGIDLLRGLNEAILTANNVSTTNVVKYTNDAFSPYPPPSTISSTRALLLPYMSDEVQAKLSYKATTTGIRTTCDNITPNCNVQVAQPNDSAQAGSVQYGCPDKPGLTQSLYNMNFTLGPQASWNMTEFDPTGTNILARGQKANPFPIALAMIFNVDLGDVSNSTTPQLLGGMMHTRGPRLFGLLWCQVEVLSPVTYLNDRGNLQVLEESSANEGSAEVWAVSGAFSTAGLGAKIYTSGLASPLEPEANRSTALTSAYSQSLARVLLSMVAGIHDETPSLQETDVTIVQASYVPWAPFGHFVGLVLVYAMLVGWACWNVWWATRRVEVVAAMDASSSREPLSVIASRFADPGTVVFDMIASHRGTSVTVAEQEMGEVKLKLGKRGDGAFGLIV